MDLTATVLMTLSDPNHLKSPTFKTLVLPLYLLNGETRILILQITHTYGPH